MRHRSWIRVVIFSTVILAATAAASLLLIEGILRWKPVKAQSSKPPPFITEFKPKPSLESRDHKYPPGDKQRPRKCRIVIFGDTYCDAIPVNLEDSYPKRLESYLNTYGNEQGVVYQVTSISKVGHSMLDVLKMMRQYIAIFKPDMLILVYRIEDVEDYDHPEELSRLKETYCPRSFKKPVGWQAVVYDHSAVARLIEQRIFNDKRARDYMNYYGTLYGSGYSGWRKTQKAFLELADISRSMRIPAGVLIFPVFSFGFGNEYPFTDIHAAVHNALLKAGLPYLDLLPHYKDLGQQQSAHGPRYASYPDETAHRIAAEALWNDVKRGGIVSPQGVEGAPPSDAQCPMRDPAALPERGKQG